MNKKIFYIPLILILCLPIVFVVYPTRILSYSFLSDETNEWLQDQAGYYEQPSGEYIVPEYANHIVELPPSDSESSLPPPPWENGDGDDDDHHHHGSDNDDVPTDGGCTDSTTPPTTPDPTTPDPTTPPTSGNNYHQGTSPTTSSSTTTTTTVPPCVINKFELPKRAWVDIETTASWSTNNCDTAEINCISDDCIEGVENLSGSVSVGINQSKNFTIKAPGTYRYELEACGPNNCETYEDILGTGLEYIEIEALHLPWWQEIIPVLPDNLQGFLRGLIN
jgi:hypothetical protein